MKGYNMGFSTISIRDAISNINAQHNGWFLPAVQRPYVWGSRFESEKYICKLFDSLIKGYPIGVIIIWNTEKEIPYRSFIDNYKDGDSAEYVDKDLWGRHDKWLVYDGQQRLQTLYSCLRYTINNKKLAYNVLFDFNLDEDVDETGFGFFDKNEELPKGYVSMPQIYSLSENDEVSFRNEFKKTLDPIVVEQNEQKIETIISNLFKVFVKNDVPSLAYFPIEKNITEEKVNDIFQRLNSGGVPLSGSDLLFSKIKEKEYDFEDKLHKLSIEISKLTEGYSFGKNSILQLLYLIVKGTTRVDPDRIKESEICEIINIAKKINEPLKDFFKFFIYESFKITNSSIVSRGLAILPLITYLYKNYENGVKFRNISSDNLLKMKQYFILSQLNDWNTQTIINKSFEYITNSNDFPLEKIIEEINRKGSRKVDVSIETLENYKWFTLKIIFTNRIFDKSDIEGRYSPELDHIFPQKLKNRPKDYFVDIVWNMQPVTGIVNASKGNTHPKEFFEEDAKKEYIGYYDLIPDLNSKDWDDYKLFIENRKNKMINKFTNDYKIPIV